METLRFRLLHNRREHIWAHIEKHKNYVTTLSLIGNRLYASEERDCLTQVARYLKGSPYYKYVTYFKADTQEPAKPEVALPVVETSPPVAEASPPVPEVAPPVAEASPPVTKATPSVTEAAPTVPESAPTVPEASPPVTEATPPVTEAAPTVPEASPHVPVASPSVTETTPPVAEGASPVAEAAPPVTEAITPVPAAAVKTLDKLTSTEAIQDTVANGSAEKAEWQQREGALLKKIRALEAVKQDASVSALNTQLKEREEELVLTRARVQNLEMQLQAALAAPGGEGKQQLVESVKQQHEELLNKARGMIFDKTKIVKNQELQLEALGTQVQSLKDINQITKDLLEIRNSEIKAMEERYVALEARLKGEKEKFELLIRRAQVNTNINDDVKKEYETQMAIFRELKGQYEQKVQALVAENNRLKEAQRQGPST